MKPYLIILTMLMINLDLNAQTPDTLWWRDYGTSFSEIGLAGRQTPDGGFVVCGNTFNLPITNGSADVFIVKTDNMGDSLWAKVYGDIRYDEARDIQVTYDGGLVVAAVQPRAPGEGRIQLWIVKMDEDGNIMWDQLYGHSDGTEEPWAIQQTADSGYVVCGMKQDFGAIHPDSWLIKVDANGNMEWESQFGNNLQDWANSVRQTSDGGYIITGKIQLPGNFQQLYILKTDANGDSLWRKTYGTLAPGLNEGRDIRETSDGGFVISGWTTQRVDPTGAMWLLRTDASGDTLWTRVFDPGGSDKGESVIINSDGGYVMAGSAGEIDVFVAKTDPLGNEEWTLHLETMDHPEKAYTIEQSADGGYILAGTRWGLREPNPNPFLLKLGPESTTFTGNPGFDFAGYWLYENLPNPFAEQTEVRYKIPNREKVLLQLLDQSGRLISTEVEELQPPGEYKLNLGTQDLPPGRYYLRFQAGVFKQTRPIVKIN